jgi:2-isopropylmalate synthase
MSTNRITIFDTTLRDGEQAPGFSMRTDEKLKMARQLAALGVDILEAGFPIASDADAESVRMIATHVRGPVIAGLARCNAADIDRAGWSLAPAPRRRIHVFIATSDLHLEKKLRMSRRACLEAAVSAAIRNSCGGSLKPSSRPAPRPSTSRTRSATRRRTRSRRSSPRSSNASRVRTRSPGAHTATTTSGWRPPTA